MQGRIQDFKLGGGGAHLKKFVPSGGRRENIWGISCDPPLTCKYSFFPQTIKDWNTLPSKLLNIDDVEEFKNNFTGRIRQ